MSIFFSRMICSEVARHQAGRIVLTTPFDGRAIVRLEGQAGLINKEGKLILDLQSADLGMVSDELIRVEDKEKGIGCLNYNGEFIWKPTY